MREIAVWSVFLCVCIYFFSPADEVDSVTHRLTGCWRWDYYYGGIAGFPKTPAWENVRLEFSRDAQDSLNQTISYRTYHDSALADSGRAAVVIDTNGFSFPYFLHPDVFAAALGMSDTFPIHFTLLNDTLEFTHANFADDFFYGFVADSCISVPADTTSFETIDSIIHVLRGCWKWDHYFGGFAGFPPTPATSDVRLEFSQNAQDSINHTITCFSYKDSVIYYSDRCNIDDSSALPFYLLLCPVFDGIGIVGAPPIYFEFNNDTLLFPQEEFVDGFVYAFLKRCVPDDTTAVQQVNEGPGIAVFPNPADGCVIIDVKSAEPFKIKIHNSLGEVISEFQNLKSGISRVDISSLPEGIYFIRTEGEPAFFVRKLVVSR
ncbi:MAG TPA: T9SS type A sorting domain-containing protein [Chitinophagales bacterium]|nr:T9SS type A sorting domain-containing protein [Chitinophagales bacterium]